MRMNVALFIPCYVNLYYPAVGRASVSLLTRLGVHVDYPSEQTCCGQPAYNAGYWDVATSIARHCAEVFADADAVVAPSGSCASMLRHHYPRLLGTRCQVAPKTFELTEYIFKVLGITDVGATFNGRGTLHVGCHLRHELAGADAATQLLASVRGLEIIDHQHDAVCCGFGGTFAVKHPELSLSMGTQKLDHAAATGCEYLISTEASCLLHLGGMIRHDERPLKPIHIAEVLASTEAAP